MSEVGAPSDGDDAVIQTIRHYPIVPVPEPRQNRNGAPTPAVHRYRAFRDECRLQRVAIPSSGYHVVFLLPIPASWSRVKAGQHELKPHLSKPDKDNLEKAVLDAVHGDDAHIWDGRATKLWHWRGAILVSEQSIHLGDDYSQHYAPPLLDLILLLDQQPTRSSTLKVVMSKALTHVSMQVDQRQAVDVFERRRDRAMFR